MRAERKQIANDMAALLTTADYIYFVSYKGLKVADLTALRTKLAPLGAECHIYKNRVLAKVAEMNGMDALAKAGIRGDTACILGKGDAGAVAKVIDKFQQDTKDVCTAKCGYIESALLSAEEVKAIAGLPGKDALRAQLLGLLVAVPTSLVRVLNAKASSIVNVINAYKNKLEEQNQ